MADTTQNEHTFFQIDPGQLGADWAEGSTTGPQNRTPSAKMSNFGALNYGDKMSFDYTRTVLTFKEKSTLEGADMFGIHCLAQDAEKNENPLLAGSSLKYTRDDQFFRMSMYNNRGTDIDMPKFDVSDTNLVVSGMLANKNYPEEGWRSFGGRNDFSEPYKGLVR